MKKVEEKVASLTSIVGNLASDVRATEKLHDEVVCLRKEVACLQQLVSQLQPRLPDPPSVARNSKTDSVEKLYSTVRKSGKVSR